MGHRVGIIGLGTVGSRFVEQFNAHRAFDLVAAWDPDEAACSAHAAQVEIAPGAAAVVDAADVVYVAVPPFFHREYVEMCVAAGRAVFCEKPLGVDLAESRALVELVESSGVPAGVNFVFGAAPSAQRLGELIRSADGGGGGGGAVVRAELRLHFTEWPRAWHAKAQWLRLRDQGGWIREVVSHFVFLALRTLGPLRLDAASVTYADGPDGELCEVEAFARLDAGGQPVLVLGTSGGAGGDVVDFTVRGSEESLRVWDWYRLQCSSDGEWTDLLSSDRAALAADAYAAQLGALASMLDGEPSPIATFREALEVQEIIEAILSPG